MFRRVTPTVRNLLILNIAVYFLDYLLKLDLSNIFGLKYIFADSFYPFQFVTYMFLHGGSLHLLSNMFALFIFGPLLEQFWGPKRFLIFYLVTGIGSGMLYSLTDYFEKKPLQSDMNFYLENPTPENFSDFIAEHSIKTDRGIFLVGKDNGEVVSWNAEAIETQYYDNPNNENLISQTRDIVLSVYDFLSNRPMVGASGAIFGILMAFGMLFPNTTLMLLFPPIPIKAKYFVAIYGFFELYAGLQRVEGDNVAHFAHLGGMLVAFVLLKMWKKDRNKFY